MRWQKRVPPFAAEIGLATLGNSDAHRAQDVGHALTTFPGGSAAELRAAIADRTTQWEGRFYPWRAQLAGFRSQLHKNATAVRDEIRGKVLRDGTGRDLGYPGGRLRPPRLDNDALAREGGGE
jgi:hypothetical protein